MTWYGTNPHALWVYRSRERGACDRGRGGVMGSVTVTAPYVDLTLVSSYPGSSLWPRRPSQPAGPGGGPAGRSGAEAASCQAGQLQHRGTAGSGRLSGALPRQGARAELRPHSHEHCECPRALGLGCWAGVGWDHQDGLYAPCVSGSCFLGGLRESLFAPWSSWTAGSAVKWA